MKRKKLSYFMTGACIIGLSAFVSMPTFAKTQGDVEDKANFSSDVIYQIVTDRFCDGDVSNNPTGAIFDKSNLKKYHGGDWKGIVDKINDGYLTKMGISALWISSPVENIMTLDPSNNSASYHGYWAKDFFETNSAFGTKEDFANLIQTAHAHHIKIVIDFAPNHTSTAENTGYTFPEDGALYKNNTLVGSFSKDNNGIFNHESWTDFSTYENGIYHSLFGLADLNQMNPTVDSYLKDAANTWLDMGVDGIRVDAVKHMPMGWQTNWLSDIYQKHSVFVFGEWFNGGTGNDPQMTNFANTSGMNLLDFRYANAVRNTIATESSTMKSLYQVMEDTQADYSDVNDQVTFIDNHDMSRFMTLSNQNASDVNEAYVLLLTSRGVPTIYYGSEQYLQGNSDPENRKDMTSFDTNSKAYQIIENLAPIRKSNAALEYGKSVQRWVNDDVLIYERQFGNDVVLTAVNRNENQSYAIHGMVTNLPSGTYSDSLNQIMNGNSITVNADGSVNDFTLAAGGSAVWCYTAAANTNAIGDVNPSLGIAGDHVAITGRGFGTTPGTVTFGTAQATVLDWSDSLIDVEVPQVAANDYAITVTNSNQVTSKFSSYHVLTGKQVATRFELDQATTDYGTAVYVVGNVKELGNWDLNKAVGPFFNSTASIASYPNWFYDISVPAGTNLEFKFIKKDSSGNVIWESGDNHKATSVSSGTGKVQVNWQN